MATSSQRNDTCDDLKWLQKCDKLKDSKGNPLLPMEAGRGVPIKDGEIVYILDEFIKKSSASEDVVKEIKAIFSDVIVSTMVDISQMFDKGGLMHDAFEKIDSQIMRTVGKVKFLCYTVMSKLFSSPYKKWIKRRELLVKICFSILCGLPKELSSLPHHDYDPSKVMKHHKAKEFLARVSLCLWKDFICMNNIPVIPEVLIPLMRKLAMLDILDPNWNSNGPWGDILHYMEVCCNISIKRIPSDKILDRKTTLLHDGRYSMRCKQMRLTQKPGLTDRNALHSWELQRKCSAPSCSNIETRNRPHTLRCQECYYFHWCSEACREYCCKYTNIHCYLCKDTPPEQKKSLKQEVEAFLSGDDPEERIDKRGACDACGAHIEEFDITLKPCTYCYSVKYCSKACQEWHWNDGDHQKICKILKKRKAPVLEERKDTVSRKTSQKKS